MGPARQNVARDWSPEPAARPEAGDPRWSQPVSNRRPPARWRCPDHQRPPARGDM